MLTGYIKHRTNLTIAEELKTTFPRNAEARRQGTSRAVNPLPYRADYFGRKIHMDHKKPLQVRNPTCCFSITFCSEEISHGTVDRIFTRMYSCFFLTSILYFELSLIMLRKSSGLSLSYAFNMLLNLITIDVH